MPARGRCKNALEVGMYRDGELGPGLFLLDRENAIADVLRSHPNDVTTALPGIEQERQRQTRARSYGIMLLELTDLIIRPAMMTRRLDPDGPYIARRVVGADPDGDRVLHHLP